MSEDPRPNVLAIQALQDAAASAAHDRYEAENDVAMARTDAERERAQARLALRKRTCEDIARAIEHVRHVITPVIAVPTRPAPPIRRRPR